MDETRIEPLRAKHQRGAFDCGKGPRNTFVRQHASVNHERGVSRVYVAVRGIQQPVLGYYASSAGAFLREHLPPDDQAGLPRYPLPTAHLGRLAVDLKYGFIPLQDDPFHLYLPMATVRGMFVQAVSQPTAAGQSGTS